MTHRQFQAWHEWFGMEADVPGKTEYYLMQIAAEIHRVHSNKPEKIDINHFRLTRKEKPKRRLMTHEERARVSKEGVAMWSALFSPGKIRVVKGSANGNGDHGNTSHQDDG